MTGPSLPEEDRPRFAVKAGTPGLLSDLVCQNCGGLVAEHVILHGPSPPRAYCPSSRSHRKRAPDAGPAIGRG